MYRLTPTSKPNFYYAKEINDDFHNSESQLGDIMEFISSGTPIILVDSLDDLENMGLDESNYELVS